MFRVALFHLLATVSVSAQAFLPVFNIQNGPLEIERESGQASFPMGDFFIAEEIDDQVVRFVAEYDDGTGLVTKNLDMAIFKNRTPGTRTNFLKYVSDGDYIDSFIHRSAPSFVIQGGGFKFSTGPSGIFIDNVPTDPAILNEPGVSNTIGTISMAKTGAGPDTATSQWFVSTNANSSNLDYQNDGFTVFARITKETLPNALLFNNGSEFPRLNFSASLGDAFKSTPIHKSTPSPVPISKFITFRAVSLVPLPSGQAAGDTNLAFNISSPPTPSLASANLSGNDLLIQPNGSGTTNVSVTATDSAGNEVTGIMTLLIGDTYATWRTKNFSGTDLLDDAISGPTADHDNNGITNLQAFAQGLGVNETASPAFVHNLADVRLTYLDQTDSLSTRITIQRSNTLGDDWTDLDPTTVSRIPTGKTNQEAVTVSLPKSGTEAFYRIQFELLP